MTNIQRIILEKEQEKEDKRYGLDGRITRTT